MRGAIIGRAEELGAVERLLDGAGEWPAALVLEGEGGIGKTTLLEAGLRLARTRRLRWLACAGAGGSAGGYVALAELLAGVERERFAALPAPQRDALVAVLGRDGLAWAEPAAGGVPEPTAGGGPEPGAGGRPATPGPGPPQPTAGAGDWRAVATATRSLLAGLAAQAPLLVAIDDAHALDRASVQVLEFCARRPAPGLGLLVARRPDDRAGGILDTAVLAAAGPLALQRVGPLEPPALRRLLRERAARPLGRGALTRVEAAAGGNPRHALALATAAAPDGPSSPAPPLPAGLHELAEAQLAGLDDEVEQALLAVASLEQPTVDAIAQALGPRAPALLDAAEDRGILERTGLRVRFVHPLLAGAVYARAPLARRRLVHRRLADVVADPEERARQLAHGRVLPQAIPALRAAAVRAHGRGASLSAAELLELALDLGASGTLRVRTAEHHLAAGDPARARALLEVAIPALGRGRLRARALLVLAEIRCHDDCSAARALLERARDEAGADERLRVAIDLRTAAVLSQLGLVAEAATAASGALAGAERLGDGGLLSQALATSASADVAVGRTLDTARLTRALELEDPSARVAFDLRPSLTAARLLLWSGRVEQARALATALRERQEARGEQHELAWTWLALAWIECAGGELDRAAAASEQANERLAGLGTPAGRALGLAARAQVAACGGRAEEARELAREALALLERAGWHAAAWAPRATLGTLALSLGNPAEAAGWLAAPAAAHPAQEPLAARPAGAGVLAGPLPPLGDAAEALVALGRLDEAEPLVALLERRGRPLDHAWACAAAARARGLLLAARGDLEAAEQSLQRAIALHEQLSLPLDRARALLALGLVQRRRRQRLAANATLQRALETFEAVGAPLWAAQARAALAGVGLRARAPAGLTAAEERVARMAASGLTNRAIATTLHISPKTVEAKLARAYRKLGVGSRAELGARMTRRDGFAA